jgi:hypothetical protein
MSRMGSQLENSTHGYCRTGHLRSLLLVAASLFFLACSKNPRNQSADTESDTETDTETESDTFEWDTDQGEFEVVAPYLLVEGVNFHHPRVNSNGNSIVVSVSRRGVPLEDRSVHLLVFPAHQPQDLSHGFYPAVSPACDDFEGAWISQPYFRENGYLTVATTTHSVDHCNLTIASWNEDAEVVGGPHSWADLFHEAAGWTTAASPFGSMDEQGRLAIGSLVVDTGDNGEWPDGEENVYFQIDRFDCDGTQERVLGPTAYSWAQEYTTVGGGGWDKGRSYLDGDVLTLFAPMFSLLVGGDLPDPQIQYHGLVVARGTTAGEVVSQPGIVFVPSQRVGMTTGNAVYAFARNGDDIAVVATILYFGGQAGSITERQFLLFDLEGSMVHGPEVVGSTPCPSDIGVQGSFSASGLVWSGTHWGFCDLFQNETSKSYRFLLLDEQGEPVSESARLFWDIPAPIGFSYSCNVVPLGENDFAVVLYAPEVPSQTDFVPGVYVTYVTYQPVW